MHGARCQAASPKSVIKLYACWSVWIGCRWSKRVFGKTFLTPILLVFNCPIMGPPSSQLSLARHQAPHVSGLLALFHLNIRQTANLCSPCNRLRWALGAYKIHRSPSYKFNYMYKTVDGGLLYATCIMHSMCTAPHLDLAQRFSGALTGPCACCSGPSPCPQCSRAARSPAGRRTSSAAR